MGNLTQAPNGAAPSTNGTTARHPRVGAGPPAQLSRSLTQVAWHPGVALDFEEWVRHGRALGVMGRSAGWWIGDWLNYGNSVWGERYTRASKVTGYDVQTLRNMAHVASRFQPTRRRRSLSWSHHALLAPLDPDQQDEWLNVAERERLSVCCLREELRRAGRAAPTREQAEAVATMHGDPTVHSPVDVVCPECGHAVDVVCSECGRSLGS